MDVLLFDLDGTLVDSKQDIAASANAARVAVGLGPLPEEQIHGYIGEGAQVLIERTLGAEHGHLVPEGLAAWRAHYQLHLLDRTLPFPGLIDAIRGVPAKRAVVTNKPGVFARAIVEGLGLGGLFPVVVGAGDVTKRKPDPEMVHEALRRLGAHDRAALVGDTWIDGATAKAAQIAFVGVLWGTGSREELTREPGAQLVEAAAGLPAACARALRRGGLPSAKT